MTEPQSTVGLIANTAVVPPTEPVKYCLYARKSTESEERQILSIDSQVTEMLQLASKDGLNVVEIRKESHSAKDSGQRPVFMTLLTDIRSGLFNGILTWAPDRLSRNAGDLGSLVDLMDQKRLTEIRTYGQTFTNSPSEKFLLMILCSQAKLENDNKSVNVKRGQRARLQMGLWTSVAPTGYLNERRTDRKGWILIDPDRFAVIRQMFERVANERCSGRKIHNWLTHDMHFTSRSGKPLTLSNVFTILKNTFYYGVMEYPTGSGQWYQGKHEPLITKELYDRVQEQLTRDKIVRETSKEFAFTKLMTCGLCGSGITAEEKFKKLADGTTKKYIYYGCTRSKDLHCKCGYLQEGELISQLALIIDKLDLSEIGIKDKIEGEMRRYQHFQNAVLKTEQVKHELNEIDIRNYAKYMLKEGSNEEKRELLGCMKSKLVIENKTLQMSKPSQFGKI